MISKRIKQKKLSWGGTVLATEFPAHESVSIVGSMAGGRRLAGSDTLADLHASMLLEGTAKHSKKNIQEMLDSMGASLAFSAGHSRLQFEAHVRTKHLDPLLALIAEILAEPAFPVKELEVLKRRELANLSLEAQDTRTQAEITLVRLLFNPEHPNYEQSTDESRRAIESVTRAALIQYHERMSGGASLTLSVAGEIKPARVFTAVDKHFKRFPKRVVQLPSYKHAAPGEAIAMAAPIKHKANIDYLLGIATGINKNHPDFLPLQFGIQVLGYSRGFAGRLMKIVRVQEGLTYGVYSYVSGFDDHTDGYLKVYATFAPELFQRGRASIFREIRRIVRGGITAEELKKHKGLYAGNFQVQLSNSAAFAHAAHDLIVEERPLSYLDELPKRVQALTRGQVNKALKKYLIPEKLSETAAGPVNEKTLNEMIDRK